MQPLGVSQYRTQLSTFIGHLVADAALFPIETVLHRMHLQGSRAIIDNLDTGTEVMPIMTRYEGFFDCLSTLLQEEGTMGLFKGFGAVILQYALHFAVLRASVGIVIETSKLLDSDSDAVSYMKNPTIPPISLPPTSTTSSPLASVGSMEQDRSIGNFETPTGQTMKLPRKFDRDLEDM